MLRRMNLRFGFFFLALPLFAACGGKLGDGNGNDGGTGADASADAVTDAPPGFDVIVPPPPGDGGCNALAQLGAPVVMQQVAQDFTSPTSPPPPGPGTYVLDSATYYTGAGGPSGPTKIPIQVTVGISTPNQWQVVVTNDVGDQHRTYSLELATPDGPYKLSATCGATDSSFVEFMPMNSPGFVMVVREQNQPKRAVVEVFRPVKK
jgi:hypothetical protein